MLTAKQKWTGLTVVGMILIFSLCGCIKTSSSTSDQQTTDSTTSSNDTTSSKDTLTTAIQELLPEAASMSNTDFTEVEYSLNPPDPNIETVVLRLVLEKIENKSLSLILLTLNPEIQGSDNPAVLEDFNTVTQPNISETLSFLEALWKSESKGYATFLQPEFITDCTCTSEGDTATGVVRFEAKDLYAGKVHFVARRNEGKWQIEEFRLPNYGIKTVLGNDGKWQQSPIQASDDANETNAPSTTDSSSASIEKLTDPVARQLVCKAASMTNTNFKKFAGPKGNLQAGKYENKSLTLILMTLDPKKAGALNAEVLTDFQYLEEFDLQKFAAALNQSKSQGYASILQPEFITHSACDSKEETATGFVTFHAKELYSGRVHFVARPHAGSWRIEEFHLPNYKITLVLGEDGNWQHAIAEATDVEAKKPVKEATR